MSLEIIERPLEDPKVRRSLARILERNALCTVATVTPQRKAHVNTTYFAYSADLDFYFFSYPSTQHALNLLTNPSMALAVFDSDQAWGRPDRGLQFFGNGRAAVGRWASDAERVYDRRFPAHAYWRLPASSAKSAPPPRPFRFRPSSVKLLDEGAFGAGVLVRVVIPGHLRTLERLPRVSVPFARQPAAGPA